MANVKNLICLGPPRWTFFFLLNMQFRIPLSSAKLIDVFFDNRQLAANCSVRFSFLIFFIR
jgi:hypothetical protein